MNITRFLIEQAAAGLSPILAQLSALKVPRRLDSTAWPMVMPFVLQAPPAVTNGVANAATAINGSVLHSILQPSKFTILGGPQPRGINYPNYLGASLGTYPQITSAAPCSVEFYLDTADAQGRFEISSKGGGGGYRVLIKQPDGAWGAVSQWATRTLPADGNAYLDLVTLGSPGLYTVRIEFDNGFVFNGVRVIAADTISAVMARKKRYIVVGDSFTEPTISDAGGKFNHYGWVPALAYLTGYDIWCAGSGGTGYVKTNGARPKFFDRLLADVLSFECDGIIWAGGINDIASPIDVFASEVNACFSAAAMAGKEQIVISPFYPGGIEKIPATAWQYRDVLMVCAAKYKSIFIDLLGYGGIPQFLSASRNYSATLTSAYAAGTNVDVSALPAQIVPGGNTGLDKWYLRIGEGSSQYVREVMSIANIAAPFRIGLSAALLSGFPIGTPVTLGAASYQTGTGRQGATIGDGNSDRYTGVDTTHPTVAGHLNIARCVADIWSQAIRS